MRIVVFDLDETLGYFVQFGFFWEALKICKKELLNDCFNECLDLFPEFIRPNINPILTYLKHQRESGLCSDVMIYTNNQGSSDWLHRIIKYFEYKLGFSIFNNIITAFKKNGKLVELLRTSHSKSHSDFIKCTRVPKDTQICFIDDTYYSEMNHENVYYIKIKPYVHMLPTDEMLTRLGSSRFGTIISNEELTFLKLIIRDMMQHNSFFLKNKSTSEYEIDKIISKKIIKHLQIFFSK